MTAPAIAIIGGGAAGSSAAKRLRACSADLDVTLFTRTGQEGFNRTLVNKGVAIGLLTPEQTALPDPGFPATADTVRGINPRTRQVHLDSGSTRTFDALIITTGSRPRQLDETIIGRDQAIREGRLRTLHSLADAVHVRDSLVASSDPARVLMLGGGLVAAETASLLADAGHHVSLIARAPAPGASAIGEHVASRLLELQRLHLTTYTGRTVSAIRTHSDGITIVLDDDTGVDGDLAIVAHGTIPAAPAPWNGHHGIPVDSHLRALHAPEQRIYAAGGVALHHYPGTSSYRIDHWDDSVAQGTHAATTLLHDLGLKTDPGTYLPSTTFSARVHGHTITGAGHPALGANTSIVSTDPLLVSHSIGDTPVAFTGIDAGRLIHDHLPRLHAR